MQVRVQCFQVCNFRLKRNCRLVAVPGGSADATLQHPTPRFESVRTTALRGWATQNPMPAGIRRWYQAASANIVTLRGPPPVEHFRQLTETFPPGEVARRNNYTTLPLQNCIVEDRDGAPLLLVFRHMQDAVGIRHGLSVEQLRRTTEVLTKVHFSTPSVMPKLGATSARNIRLSGTGYVFHGGVWFETGHKLRVPAPTSDTRAGAHLWPHVVHEFKDSGTWRLVGEIKDFLEGRSWRGCLGALPPYLLHHIGGNAATDPDALPGNIVAMNFNNLSQSHFDVRNLGWGIMTVHGDFTEQGSIVFPDEEIICPLRPGDIIACMFQKLRHYVEETFKGNTRYTAVHALHREVHSAYVKNNVLWTNLCDVGLRNIPMPDFDDVNPQTTLDSRALVTPQSSRHVRGGASSSVPVLPPGSGSSLTRAGPIKSAGLGRTSAGRQYG